ncbi:hypothetical protein [Candidatus Finniella inopinata]|uniref:Uncharacterized protein n=1 Tax=Candidatus Finniella inopinata TaxID=1696036 RepID=A0A4Q7DLH5_9PROT|nr:hypothetical protein [Candidatus Finniella inopinata]RZI47024.1 hypothetical protein EQU50_00090 [Candidatus Finniella inopinata]
MDASEFPEHIYTAIDELCKDSEGISANQILHIYESDEGLGVPYKTKKLEHKGSKLEASLEPRIEASLETSLEGSLESSLETPDTITLLNQNGSFCGQTPKSVKKISRIQLAKEKKVIGLVVSSPLGYWPSAPTLKNHSVDLGQNGTVIISYIKNYRGYHKKFKTNFLAFQAYSEDKRTENGYGFPLAVNGTLQGANIQFIKNAVTLTTSSNGYGGTSYQFERESFYTPLEEPFEDHSGNILRFEMVRHHSDAYLRIHPLTKEDTPQDTELTKWARMLGRLSFNRRLYASNERLITPSIASSCLVSKPIISTRDLPCLLPLAPQIISFARNCLSKNDVLQTLSVPVKSLFREAMSDPLVLIPEPSVYGNSSYLSTPALNIGQKSSDDLRLKAKNWLSNNLPGFEKAGEYFEGPVSVPTKQTTTKRELSDPEIISLINGQLRITPQLLELSGIQSVSDKHLQYLASQRNTGELRMISLAGTSITVEGIMALGKSRYLGRNRVGTTKSKISVLIKDSPAAKDYETQERAEGQIFYRMIQKNFSIIDPITGKKTKGGKKVLQIFS